MGVSFMLRNRHDIELPLTEEGISNVLYYAMCESHQNDKDHTVYYDSIKLTKVICSQVVDEIKEHTVIMDGDNYIRVPVSVLIRYIELAYLKHGITASYNAIKTGIGRVFG